MSGLNTMVTVPRAVDIGLGPRYILPANITVIGEQRTEGPAPTPKRLAFDHVAPRSPVFHANLNGGRVDLTIAEARRIAEWLLECVHLHDVVERYGLEVTDAPA